MAAPKAPARTTAKPGPKPKAKRGATQSAKNTAGLSTATSWSIGAAVVAVGAAVVAFLNRDKIGEAVAPVLDGVADAAGIPAAGHAAPDLEEDVHPDGSARAPYDFRPDPTAMIADTEREALRPATGAAPTLVA